MNMVIKSKVIDFFEKCVQSINSGKLIQRESKKDKEFHFQNWVKSRFDETKILYEMGGRNSYPDFRLVKFTEGYEVKGLAYPGRESTYDCNSQVPSGFHNGRIIYYIFGRYPAEPDGNQYPVIDLVICHGDFLNADHSYIHKNKSIKGFGSYGDIMIRDRKMYVAPMPFGIVEGLAHTQTLILPKEYKASSKLKCVGEIIRIETEKLIVGYNFDLKENSLEPKTVNNPNAGKKHSFLSWRLMAGSDQNVKFRENKVDISEIEYDDQQ
jgi:hypothetical protein